MKQLIILLFLLTACKSVKTNILATNNTDRKTFFPKTDFVISNMPTKENTWVFILAGQSNMAGRGLVEPIDTLPSPRILTINQSNQVILAKEPLHFYEPELTGLDCGLSFGKELIKHIPAHISLLIIPTAVGGSSLSQWNEDLIHRNVQLLSNFKEKVKFSQEFGQIKAILWHQGESDANENDIPHYQSRLLELFTKFKKIIGNEQLPILMGELGVFSKTNDDWQKINQQMRDFASKHTYISIIKTADFEHKGDFIHFNSEAQRKMGQRFAKAYLKRMK